MSVSLSEVLSNVKNPVLVVDARLNNTAKTPHGFEDMVAGPLPIAGLDLSFSIENNSAIRATAGQALNSGGSDVVQEGLVIEYTLADIGDGSVDQSVGDIALLYKGNDNIHFRDWDNRRITIKIGGDLNGSPMVFDDYPLLLTGISNGHDFDESRMNASISTASKELANVFPPNIYTSGEEKGQVRPVAYGQPDNISPIDQGDGYFEWSDSSLGNHGGINAAYNNGTLLSYDSDGDLSVPPASGFYKYEALTSGTRIRVNLTDYEDMVLTLDVNGRQVTSVLDPQWRSIVQIAADIVKVGCKERVPVTFEGVTGTPVALYTMTEEVGIYITEQKSVREHLIDILSPHDLYFTENLDDNGITIRRRYPGRSFDFLGIAQNRAVFDIDSNAIVEGSVERIATERRPRSTRVFYNRNWNPLTGDGIPAATRRRMKREYDITPRVVSSGGKSELRDIETYFTLESEALAFQLQTAGRDGARNQRYQLTVYGLFFELYLGAVGKIDHPLIPDGFIEVRSYQINTYTRQTNLVVVAYE